MIPFIIVTDLFRISLFPGFAYTQLGTRQSRFAHPLLTIPLPPLPFTGPAWYINLVSWAFSFLIVFGVIWAGNAADKGHRWAAGNRAYTRIQDHE